MRPLSEQVVVTGASSGIGRATAAELASAGAQVVAAARGEDALASLVATSHGRVVAVPTDVTDMAAVRALAAEAVTRFGRVDTRPVAC